MKVIFKTRNSMGNRNLVKRGVQNERQKLNEDAAISNRCV